MTVEETNNDPGALLSRLRWHQWAAILVIVLAILMGWVMLAFESAPTVPLAVFVLGVIYLVIALRKIERIRPVSVPAIKRTRKEKLLLAVAFAPLVLFLLCGICFWGYFIILSLSYHFSGRSGSTLSSVSLDSIASFALAVLNWPAPAALVSLIALTWSARLEKLQKRTVVALWILFVSCLVSLSVYSYQLLESWFYDGSRFFARIWWI